MNPTKKDQIKTLSGYINPNSNEISKFESYKYTEYANFSLINEENDKKLQNNRYIIFIDMIFFNFNSFIYIRAQLIL